MVVLGTKAFGQPNQYFAAHKTCTKRLPFLRLVEKLEGWKKARKKKWKKSRQSAGHAHTRNLSTFAPFQSYSDSN
jgi:hypothetical protein